MKQRQTLVLATLFTLILAVSLAGPSVADSDRAPQAGAPVIHHTCSDDSCPLDGNGCHEDERGQNHCH